MRISKLLALAAALALTLGAAPALSDATPPSVGGCQVLPAGDSFNQDLSAAPVDSHSQDYIDQIQGSGGDFLHPDFGGGGQYGIPFIVVPHDQKLKPVRFKEYPDESDRGVAGEADGYPIPRTAPVEGGGTGDAHVLAVRQGDCHLFELYHAKWSRKHKRWNAGSGAIFNLNEPLTPPQRTPGWTSADAAGLPILPGLVRYDEVAAGAVNHAIRITFANSANAYIDPASHCAPHGSGSWRPPMGMRLRLNMPDARLNTFTGQAKVILTAMRRYGVIMADNGSNWYFQGDADPRWDDEDLHQLTTVSGSEFVVVDAPGASLTAC